MKRKKLFGRKPSKHAVKIGSLKIPREVEGLKFVAVLKSIGKSPSTVFYSAFEGFKKEPPLFDPVTVKACITASPNAKALASRFSLPPRQVIELEKKRLKYYKKKILGIQKGFGSNYGVEVLRAKTHLNSLGIDAFMVFRLSGGIVYRAIETKSSGEMASMLFSVPRKERRFTEVIGLDRQGNLFVKETEISG